MSRFHILLGVMLFGAVFSTTILPDIYAELIPFPSLSDKHLDGNPVYTTGVINNETWWLNIYLQFNTEDEFQVPQTITVTYPDGTTETILPQEVYLDVIGPSVPIPEEYVSERYIPETLPSEAKQPQREDVFIDEKHKILSEIVNCRYGYDETIKDSKGNLKGLGPIQPSQAFQIPDEEIYFGNIPLNTNTPLRTLVQAWEACVALPKIVASEPSYENIIVDDLEVDERYILDEYDSPLTVPITEQDIINEAKRAEDYISKVPWYVNPYIEPKDDPNVGYTDGAECGQRPGEIDEDTGRYIKSPEQVCPKQSKAQYDAGKFDKGFDEEKAACEMMWKYSAQKGNISIKWWSEPLKKGQCDIYLPEVKEKRDALGYLYTEFKGQNSQNCTDCPRFD